MAIWDDHIEIVNPGGLIWVSEWNALLHPTAAAFLAVIYSDYMLTSKTARFSCGDRDKRYYKPSDLRDFAKSQVRTYIRYCPFDLTYAQLKAWQS